MLREMGVGLAVGIDYIVVYYDDDVAAHNKE
jgi:hypothetical protein